MPQRPHSPRRETEDRRHRTYPLPSVSTQSSHCGRTDQSLPSIQDILPDIASSNRQNLAELASPLNHEPSGPGRSSSGRGRLSPPFSTRSAPISPNQVNDRRHGPDGYEELRLPLRSGTASSRESSSLSASGWPDRLPPSTVTATNAYVVQAPTQRDPLSAGYRYATRTPDHNGYDRNGGSSLPPPPPQYQTNTNGYGHSYETARDYSNGSASYNTSPYADDRPRRPTNGNATTHPPNHGVSVSSPYGQQAGMSQGGYPTPVSRSAVYQYGNGEQPTYETGDGPAPRRRRGNLPRWVTDYLKAWLLEHIAHPYPTEQEKNHMCQVTGLQMTQISNWFINARRRRTPELTMQAQAEAMLRDNSGHSNSNSD